MSEDFKDFDKLIKSFKDSEKLKGRIGILGQSNTRSDSKLTSNAEIGLVHEFGNEKMPERSFLRMPLNANLMKRLEQLGAFDKESQKKVLKEGSLAPWLERVMVVAEQVVQEAFASHGFGKWKKSDMKRKKVHQTLVESQQLRNSITSEVLGND